MIFQACYARVLDFRRKFIEAAVRYNELSYKTMVAEDERITALRNALICTVLASAGMCTVTLNETHNGSAPETSSGLVFHILCSLYPQQTCLDAVLVLKY